MGCTSSKRIEDTVVNPYRPSPASFSIFDVYAIEEPWLNAPGADNDHKKPFDVYAIEEPWLNAPGADNDHKKPSHVPPPILEKLNAIEEAPRTWDEVSKVLEDLKPKLQVTLPLQQPPPLQIQETPAPVPRAAPPRRKSFSFHTLEELEARANSSKLTTSKTTKNEPKFEFARSRTQKTDSQSGVMISSDVPRSLKDNMFIVRDKVEREREAKPSGLSKRDKRVDLFGS